MEKKLEAAHINDCTPGFPTSYLRVIWITGQDCGGCATTILNYLADPADPDPVLHAIANNAVPGIPPLIDIEAVTPQGADGDIDIAEVVLEIVTIDWGYIIMAASGDVANYHLQDLRDAGGYALLIDGAIPTADNGQYCQVFSIPGNLKGAPTDPWYNLVTYDPVENRTDFTMHGATLWLAKNAVAVVALGTCSSWGGVPAANGGVTGAKSSWEVIDPVYPCVGSPGGTLPLVNVPGCPPNPDWFVATVGAAILELTGIMPGILLGNLDLAVDHKNRPKLTYCSPGNTIYHKAATNYQFCQNCARNTTKPGLATIGACQKRAIQPNGLCLKTTGCNGYRTDNAVVRADCPTRKWNNHTNWCNDNNMPCQGCTDPGFPDKSSPFYVIKSDPDVHPGPY
jgi:hydrogenase small subunit